MSRTTTSDLDTKIDDLYRGPLDAFTASRNSLVKTLRGADATHVRTLAKPTAVAWAVNQVYWHARTTWDRLHKSGEQLRHAQIAALKGKPADVREASDAHRRAVGDAVQEAERLARDGRTTPSAATSSALMRTFEALSLAPEPPARPGRLTQPLQPAGFEALAGVTPAARNGGPERAAPPAGARGPRHSKRSAEDERRQAAEARRLAAERAREQRHRQAEIKKAEAALERARAAEAFAREGLARAERDRREAEARLKQLQS